MLSYRALQLAGVLMNLNEQFTPVQHLFHLLPLLPNVVELFSVIRFKALQQYT